MIRIVHTADWHADSDPVKLQKLISSLDELEEFVKNNKVNILLIAGDIWEKKQTFSQKSGVPLILDKLRCLCLYVDRIYIIKGNNAHDEVGSVELINEIDSDKIFATEDLDVIGIDLFQNTQNIDEYNLLENANVPEKLSLIVSMVPYPTKSNFVSNDSIDNNNADFIQKFEEIFELIGDVTTPYSCPKVLMFHGNVVGSRLSSGQSLVSQDIMVAPRTLQKANADYYALGHIHLRQEVAPNMVYSGSMYNKNWGETEPKSFEVIEFDDSGMKTEQVYFQNANPMVTLFAEFKNGEFSFQDSLETIDTAKQPNSEVRLKYSVAESERNLVTAEKIAELKFLFGENLKIEEMVIPDVRESRSEQIMDAKSLFEEVVEFARIISQELPETIKSKIESIEEHK